MNEQQQAIKDLTDLWLARMDRLMNKKLLTTDPNVVYPAALSLSANLMVRTLMHFDEHQHQRMLQDLSNMISSLYQIKMRELKRDQPRIIVAH